MKFDLKIVSSSLIFALVIILFTQYYNWRSKLSEPIDNWITINQLSLPPTMKSGMIPTVVFDMDIKQKIISNMSIELQRIDTSQTKTICYNTIKNNKYPLTEKQGINYSLDILLGNKCVLPPGTYRIYCRWLIERGLGYPEIWLEKTSNIFEIID